MLYCCLYCVCIYVQSSSYLLLYGSNKRRLISVTVKNRIRSIYTTFIFCIAPSPPPPTATGNLVFRMMWHIRAYMACPATVIARSLTRAGMAAGRCASKLGVFHSGHVRLPLRRCGIAGALDTAALAHRVCMCVFYVSHVCILCMSYHWCVSYHMYAWMYDMRVWMYGCWADIMLPSICRET